MRREHSSTCLGRAMTTYSLLLLPGDGIGVEVMAEVERVVSFFNKKGKVRVQDQDRARRRLGHRQVRRAARQRDAGRGAGCRRRRVRRGRRAEVGQGALREASRGRPAQAAQGPRSVRQPAPRHLLSGARRGLLAQARGGRGPRHPHPARADRRHLLRRAQGDRDARKTARSAPSTPPSTPRARSSASPASPSTSPASARTRCTRPRSATS